jgi:hypothetical protein
VNEKVRDVAAGSLWASSIMSLKVMLAVAALWVGLGEGVAEAPGPGAPEVMAVPELPPVGPPATEALGVAVGPPPNAGLVAVADGPPEFDPK